MFFAAWEHQQTILEVGSFINHCSTPTLVQERHVYGSDMTKTLPRRLQKCTLFRTAYLVAPEVFSFCIRHCTLCSHLILFASNIVLFARIWYLLYQHIPFFARIRYFLHQASYSLLAFDTSCIKHCAICSH